MNLHRIGTPCDANGDDLPPGEAPPPCAVLDDDDFSPYEDRANFEIADFLYRRNQMPGTHIDDLMRLWAAKEDSEPPYASTDHLYETIDSTTLGDAPWESFSVKYQGPEPAEGAAPWMTQEYDVWCRNTRTVIRNQLANPDFAGEIDYSAKQVFAADGQREYSDMMSGNWAWQQSVSDHLHSYTLHVLIFVYRILLRLMSIITGQHSCPCGREVTKQLCL